MDSLYILCYMKKKDLRFPIELQSGSNALKKGVEALGLAKDDSILVVNQKDIRGKSLATIKSILENIKDNTAVSLIILKKNGDRNFLNKKKYPSLNYLFLPRVKNPEIQGFCDRCPEGRQVLKYSKSVDWYAHVT